MYDESRRPDAPKESPQTGRHATTGASGGGRTERVRERASEAADRAQDRMMSAVDERREDLADQIESISHAVHDAADRLHESGEQIVGAQYVGVAADRLEALAAYLRQHDTNELIHEATDTARRHPEIFLGAAAVTGLLLGRFLRSSPPRGRSDGGGAGTHQAPEATATEGRPAPNVQPAPAPQAPQVQAPPTPQPPTSQPQPGPPGQPSSAGMGDSTLRPRVGTTGPFQTPGATGSAAPGPSPPPAPASGRPQPEEPPRARPEQEQRTGGERPTGGET